MEDNSPYKASQVLPAPPSSPPADSWVIEIPRDITRPIKHMWLMLAAMAAIALVAALVLLFTRNAYGSVMAIVLGVAAVMYALLALGIYKRSFIVAGGVVGVCAMSILGTLVSLSRGDVSLVSIGASVIMTFFSVRGMFAIQRFHRFVADARRRPPGPRLSDDPTFASKPEAAG